MAASIRRLQTRPEKLRQDQAAEARQLLLDLVGKGYPEAPLSRAIAVLDRETATTNRWTFVMLSPTQHRAVVEYLLEVAEQPKLAVLIWATLFEHLRADTCEVILTRYELADLVKASPDAVSRVMSHLVECGAVSRQRVKIAGMRGRGAVRWFLNPNVATKLAGKARDDAQAKTPPLKLPHIVA